MTVEAQIKRNQLTGHNVKIFINKLQRFYQPLSLQKPAPVLVLPDAIGTKNWRQSLASN